MVAQDTPAIAFGFSETTAAVQNLVGHLASVVAGNTEIGTTDFTYRTTTAESTSSTTINAAVSALSQRSWNKFVVGEKATNDAGTTVRWGNNSDYYSLVASIATPGAVVLTLRDAAPRFWANTDSFYLANAYAIGPNDTLTTIVDRDTDNKRFVVPMYRRLTPTTATYGSSNDFLDADNGSQSLTGAFGLGYSFNDFVAYMRSRLLTHSADATKRILWRWKRYGADGDRARLRYAYPTAASQSLQVSVDNQPTPSNLEDYNLVSVLLPSGAARSDATFLPREATRMGYGLSVVGGRNVITVACGFPVSSASRTTTDVTLTLDLTMGLYNLTNHGLVAGNVIYLASSSGSFSPGAKLITSVTPTTIVYAEAGTAAGPIASIGSISTDSVERRLNTGSVAVGDVIRLGTSTAIPSGWRGRSIRINNLGDRYIQGYADTDTGLGSTSTTLAYSILSSPTNISIFPINSGSATATAIAASVNALGDGCPVTATVTGTGAGTVLLSSRDEAATADELVEYAALSDGINWVQTTTSPGTLAGNYTLAFKAPIAASLVANSDWLNEEVRVVPTTATTITAWLNTLGVCGLSRVADVSVANDGRAPQIASVTPGSSGSVQVQGGSANASSASIVGSLNVFGTLNNHAIISIPADQSAGFTAGTMAMVANSAAPSVSLSSSLVLSSNDVNGNLAFSAGTLYSAGVVNTSVSSNVQVKRQGRYVMITNLPTISGTARMIYIGQPGTDPVSLANTGTFRIIAMSDAVLSGGKYTVWIENPNAVEEDGKRVSVIFINNGPMAGDYLSISGDEWGAENKGLWRIESVGTSSAYVGSGLKLDTSSRPWVVQSTPAAALGAASSKFRVIPSSTIKCVARMNSISPNASNASLVDVRFSLWHDTGLGGSYSYYLPGDYEISDVYGAVLTSLDKLAFGTDIVPGVDGYRYNTGLLGEVNRVIMGDPRDPTSYPGVVAAGTNVNISGPLVKRIQVALAIRLRLGVLPQSAISYVRSAVAATINSFGVGKPVVISNLVAAAASINGVTAVSIVSPTYNSDNDLITVQPYEKPLVLNAEQDITVSIVGD